MQVWVLFFNLTVNIVQKEGTYVLSDIWDTLRIDIEYISLCLQSKGREMQNPKQIKGTL